MPNLDGYLSVRQAAKYAGIPVRTIHAAITRGQLRAYRLGDGATSAYAIDIDDLDNYITERTA